VSEIMLSITELRAREVEIIENQNPPPVPDDQERRLLQGDPQLRQAMMKVRCWGECSESQLCANCVIRRQYLWLLLHREKFGMAAHPKVAVDGHFVNAEEFHRQRRRKTWLAWLLEALECEPEAVDALRRLLASRKAG